MFSFLPPLNLAPPSSQSPIAPQSPQGIYGGYQAPVLDEQGRYGITDTMRQDATRRGIGAIGQGLLQGAATGQWAGVNAGLAQGIAAFGSTKDQYLDAMSQRQMANREFATKEQEQKQRIKMNEMIMRQKIEEEEEQKLMRTETKKAMKVFTENYTAAINSTAKLEGESDDARKARQATSFGILRMLEVAAIDGTSPEELSGYTNELSKLVPETSEAAIKVAQKLRIDGIRAELEAKDAHAAEARKAAVKEYGENIKQGQDGNWYPISKQELNQSALQNELAAAQIESTYALADQRSNNAARTTFTSNKAAQINEKLTRLDLRDAERGLPLLGSLTSSTTPGFRDVNVLEALLSNPMNPVAPAGYDPVQWKAIKKEFQGMYNVKPTSDQGDFTRYSLAALSALKDSAYVNANGQIAPDLLDSRTRNGLRSATELKLYQSQFNLPEQRLNLDTQVDQQIEQSIAEIKQKAGNDPAKISEEINRKITEIWRAYVPEGGQRPSEGAIAIRQGANEPDFQEYLLQSLADLRRTLESRLLSRRRQGG